MDRSFVFVFGQVPVNAVIADIELAAYKPFPERGITGIKRGMPGFIPVQEIGVFLEAIRIDLSFTFAWATNSSEG
jgi:hypothetical protein